VIRPQESEVNLLGAVFGHLGYAVSVKLFDVATALLPATTERTWATQLPAGAEARIVNAAEQLLVWPFPVTGEETRPDVCRGQLSLAPHLVQKVAEEVFCVPQVGQSFIPAWKVVVGAIGIWPAGAWAALARLE
jgi:hypothetical protein